MNAEYLRRTTSGTAMAVHAFRRGGVDAITELRRELYRLDGHPVVIAAVERVEQTAVCGRPLYLARDVEPFE